MIRTMIQGIGGRIWEECELHPYSQVRPGVPIGSLPVPEWLADLIMEEHSQTNSSNGYACQIL
jgi:hypothetical protein